MSVQNLPFHILQRICQYLMDDPTVYHCWFSGGVRHLLRLRTTSRHFDQVVRESCLKFSLVHDYYQAIQEIGDNYLELQDNFLTLVNTEFNWRCTVCDVELPTSELDWTSVQNFVVKLSKYQPMARNVCYLKIDVVGVPKSYNEILKLFHPLLSPSAEIDLKVGLGKFREKPMPQVLSDRVIKLRIVDDLEDEMQLSILFCRIWRIFSNVRQVQLASDRAIAWKQLALTRGACKILVHHLRNLDDSCISELKEVSLQNVKHLAIGNVENVTNFDFSIIQNHFSNLSSLSIGFLQNELISNIANFDLPRSCTTVKINFILLKFIVNSSFIKNLMIQTYWKSYEMPVSKKNVEEFAFQLETFVFVSHKLSSMSYTDYVNQLILPLLEFQKSLKVLTIDFYDESYFDEESEVFIENYALGQNDLNELRNVVTKEKSALQAHKCIKYLRLKDIFVVLKLSLSKQLITFIDDLDLDHSWSIRILYCSGKTESESVLPLQTSDFTIT